MPFPYTEYGMTWPDSPYVDKVDEPSYRIPQRAPIEVPIETCLLEQDPEYNIKSKYFNQIRDFIIYSQKKFDDKIKKMKKNIKDEILKKLSKKFEDEFLKKLIKIFEDKILNKLINNFEDELFKKVIKKFEIYFDDEFTGDVLLKDFIKIILDIKRDNVLKTLKDLIEYYRGYREKIIVVLWKIFEMHEASKIIGTIPLLFFPPKIEAENKAQRTIFQIKLELQKIIWYHNDCKALIIVINKKLDERELENK
tara:strand:+ start:1484 stop:2239 length:756 start_codon:yes stop_codon:yes gene_type:complete